VFTGRENDATGLFYYRARYYSPTLQRFVSQDPISFAGGDSLLYGYAFQNPVNIRDPRGHGFLGIGIGIGGVIGGISGANAVLLQEGANWSALDVFEGAVLGTAFGAILGAVDPSEGISLLLEQGFEAGVIGDVVGQLWAHCGNVNKVNPFEALGAGIGGALGNATGGLTAGALTSLGAPELAADVGGAAVGYTPSVVGGAAGEWYTPGQVP
jgi:RHS repeat-associated protein